VIGIVTATDLMRSIASRSVDSSERPSAAAPDGWGDLPGWVEGGERPSTFFTEPWPERGDAVPGDAAASGDRRSDAADELTVGEAMTRGPLCALAPTVPVSAAADYMRRAHVHRILVMEGDRLVGIVSSMDIAREVADRRLTTKVYLFGDQALPDERGSTITEEPMSSGTLEEDRFGPAVPEVPSGEAGEESTTPTSPPEEPR
jgi:CBS domain-containing protein